jgi:RNA polymerase sigma factor (TIGR02999 family)
MANPAPDLTQYLNRLSEGDEKALEELLPHVYDHLIHLARRIRREKGATPTLNTTALVHESYLKLIQQSSYENRIHFFRVAARAMRQVSLQLCGTKNGGQTRRPTEQSLPGGSGNSLATQPLGRGAYSIEQSLRLLERMNQRQAQVLECRFFGGMSVEETGVALQISPATVKRDWNLARSWLYQQLNEKPPSPHG